MIGGVTLNVSGHNWTCNAKGHVRFTPKSGHMRCKRECPLWARSGHWLALLSQTFDRIDSEFRVLLTIHESFGVGRRSKRSLRLVKIFKSYHYDPLRRLASNRYCFASAGNEFASAFCDDRLLTS